MQVPPFREKLYSFNSSAGLMTTAQQNINTEARCSNNGLFLCCVMLPHFCLIIGGPFEYASTSAVNIGEGLNKAVFRRKDLCDAKHDARITNFVSKNSVLLKT